MQETTKILDNVKSLLPPAYQVVDFGSVYSNNIVTKRLFASVVVKQEDGKLALLVAQFNMIDNSDQWQFIEIFPTGFQHENEDYFRDYVIIAADDGNLVLVMMSGTASLYKREHKRMRYLIKLNQLMPSPADLVGDATIDSERIIIHTGKVQHYFVNINQNWVYRGYNINNAILPEYTDETASDKNTISIIHSFSKGDNPESHELSTTSLSLPEAILESYNELTADHRFQILTKLLDALVTTDKPTNA